MSRREIRTTRRDANRAKQRAEHTRRRQAEDGYWTTFATDPEVTR